MDIAEVRKLKDGMPVTDLRVRFVRAFERHTGDGEFGPWARQNFEVEDESGKLTVFAKDRPEDFTALDWEGKEITISAVKSAKGWTGALTFDDEYNDKVTRKIKLTKSGVCRLAEPATEPAPESAPAPKHALTLDDACEIMRIVHRISKEIYPESPDAAAAVGNTLFIAISQGRVRVIPPEMTDGD